MKRRRAIAAAAWLAAAALWTHGAAPIARANGSVSPTQVGEDLAARLTSDSWSVRRGAERELRALAAGEVGQLATLAAHEDACVRIAAIDALSAWMRSDDVERRAAARRTLTELADSKSRAATLAATRFESLLMELERTVLDRLREYVDPPLVPT